MNGNISVTNKFYCLLLTKKDKKILFQKIAQKYHQNPQEYFYLEDMLLAEKAQGGNVATDALQWLKRYIQRKV